MQSNISAEEGALEQGAIAVADAKTAIDGQVKFVRGEIEQLSGMWTGPAAAKFAQLMGEWDSKTSRLNAVLDNLEASLRGTARDQAATDDSHQQVISGLGSMMGA
ncbi:WXG100 family type VII secretion target [Xylanimonas allomyrinae]|uniref:ESAT-6-like protein n=1 Tax=Xylanimonas allomyrinae TaxID=2509459 RepID=A0A4P6F2U5_9MICO|nr:WXG100 family type VII secretion target [Xylanimonas allomyrinae]